LAGAAGVDDSGLVLLCPKDKVDNIFVDFAEYVAVVGNGGNLAPKSKAKESALCKESVSMDIVSKLRKGRGDDPVQTVRVTVPEVFSTCSTVTDPCQAQFQDGIRGDPAANPFDRRAPRRLIHCNSLSVSSLIVDESLRAETPSLPDDIAVLADRRNHLEYNGSSFLGRTALKNNPSTTAYREINGDADGFPGWTVDRYDKWLLVNHDPKMPRGPLPSIHDGSTTGVYYLESNPDRSAMGSETDIRPRFLEGKPAPEGLFPVLENGVTYLVSLDRDLSTGIFLDQRPQRAWLTKNCCAETRVLNCFAHTGAFSVAAATAGASTVSLDLSKKWLDRLPEQLQSNGIDFDERHDCIHGDCFDWLTRLAKRGEKYDIVILDPPSSSVGGRKKKRWSVKNDMDELVALASTLVKKGGLLWTTTNSASIHPIKFARLCRKGLEDAGIKSAKLERIQPMPVDFPTVGPQPVKNFVWRIP
jgi:23S rRNA (cytosine1962-C5)-methyltransferase